MHKQNKDRNWNIWKKLNFKCPFISENGGGIFIPSDYFNIEYEYTKKVGAYNVIELGTNYDIIRDILKKIRTELNINIIGFGDLSIKELKADTGLDMESARRAKIREYDEAFKIDSRDKNIEKKVSKLIKYHGFNYTKGGRYWHIMGDNDKGMAVKKLTDLYKKEYDNVKTIGIGDTLNDLPMLQSVDIPLLVQKYNGTHDININATAEVIPEGEVIEERVIDGQRIVEMIEELLVDVWEALGLAYLFDIIIDFFRGVWEWMKAAFEAGLERIE